VRGADGQEGRDGDGEEFFHFDSTRRRWISFKLPRRRFCDPEVPWREPERAAQMLRLCVERETIQREITLSWWLFSGPGTFDMAQAGGVICAYGNG
jgi:hypothetical protein